VDLSILGANLRRLRTRQKQTQGELADAAGLSREGYRRIEEGLVEPRVDSLMRIATVLGVRPEELLLPVKQLRAVRFRAKKRMITREDLLATVARWLGDYAELEQLLNESASYELASLSASWRRRRRPIDPVTAAAEARAALGLRENDSIRDICGLLEDNGVKVYKPVLASEGFFGLSVGHSDGGPAVVVNCWDRISVERWIFTVAHELGHLLMHLGAYDVDEAEEDDHQESEANLFASHFLMPEKLFQNEWVAARGMGLVDRVLKVKRIFHVSWKTVIYRASEQLPEPGRIWGQFHAQYKRINGRALKGIEEPEALPPDAFLSATPVARVADEPHHLLPSDFAEDRLLRLVRSAVEREAISLSRAAEILDIDLRSMRQLAGSWSE
jgi:Zn-dependent peptidase ImmA (M78 family)/transcriptional regulator with XRE-family HTH domain